MDPAVAFATKLQRLLVEGPSLRGLTAIFEDVGEAPHIRLEAAVAEAGKPTRHPERLAVQSSPPPRGRPVAVRAAPRITERAGNVGMRVAGELAVDREGLARQLLRRRVVRACIGEGGQAVERVGDLDVLGPQLPLPDGEGLPLLPLRHVVEAQALVDAAHGLEHAGPGQGPALELRGDALGAPVEDLAGGDRFPQRFAGIGDLEQADQEADHLLHLLAAPAGRGHARPWPASMPAVVPAMPASEGERHHCGRHHAGLVPLHELPQRGRRWREPRRAPARSASGGAGRRPDRRASRSAASGPSPAPSW